MVHDEAWELLLAEYVEGTLAPGARARVEQHLAACERCRADVALASAAVVRSDPPFSGDDAAFLAAVERRAERTLAAGGAAAPGPQIAPWKAAAGALLAHSTQARPAFWFFCSLPVFGLFSGPTPALLAMTAAGLVLGFLMEYLVTWEASRHDSH
ncbi:MAG TPA: zf-HC2 domain-containing protein [Symbiobacteriaceae bacterium]|nr:zf-HC2 domain-containing protein [Symbiobacteriaceae bacterium]